jgi:hypothetical protein
MPLRPSQRDVRRIRPRLRHKSASARRCRHPLLQRQQFGRQCHSRMKHAGPRKEIQPFDPHWNRTRPHCTQLLRHARGLRVVRRAQKLQGHMPALFGKPAQPIFCSGKPFAHAAQRVHCFRPQPNRHKQAHRRQTNAPESPPPKMLRSTCALVFYPGSLHGRNSGPRYHLRASLPGELPAAALRAPVLPLAIQSQPLRKRRQSTRRHDLCSLSCAVCRRERNHSHHDCPSVASGQAHLHNRRVPNFRAIIQYRRVPHPSPHLIREPSSSPRL